MDYFLKTQANTTFSDAIIPEPDSSAAGWNKVYFGKFNKKPLKWRVVAKRSTAFSKNKDKEALFLDCDEVLTEEKFSYKGLENHGWFRSHLWLYMNGEFANENLSEPESSAVMLSYAFNDTEDKSKSEDFYDHFSNDQFFAPTPSDLQVSETRDATKYLKKQAGVEKAYWLRSYKPGNTLLGAIMKPRSTSKGTVCGLNYFDRTEKCGVSPACNISQDSILLTTKVADNTYKLTVLASFEYSPCSISMQGKAKVQDRTVTIPYNLYNNNSILNSVSVMILNKEYSNSGAKTLYYKILKTPENYQRFGDVSFDLPKDLAFEDWGSKYHVYLMGEHLSPEDETDYATSPCEITAKEVEGLTYTVKYYKNEGDSYPYVTQYVIRGRHPSAPEDPTSDKDVIFAGWYLFNGTKFDFSAEITCDYDLYAQWGEPVPYEIYVGKTQINSKNAGDVLGNGKVVYDRVNKTLTFNGITIDKCANVNPAASYMLRTYEDLTILGKVSLKSDKATGGIYVDKDVTLTVNADISISAKEYGIFSLGAKEITVSGGNLTISGPNYGIMLGGYGFISTPLSLKDGTIEIESLKAGIAVLKNGTLDIDDKLFISGPPRGETAAAPVAGHEMLTIVDQFGQVANSVLITQAPAVDALMAYFVLEDGLEYKNRRYEHIYTAKYIEPKVIVTNGRKNPVQLMEDRDYLLDYNYNRNVTTKDSPAVCTVSLRGNYKGTMKLFFHILPKPIGNGKDATPAEGITLTDTIGVNGGEISVTMFYNGHKVESKYYKINRHGQDHLIDIEGIGNYCESIKDVRYTLLSNADADNTRIKARLAFIYDGEPKVLTDDQISVKDGNGNLINPSTNCYVEYEDNVDVGTAKAHVIAKSGSGYHGESVIYFDILPDIEKSTVKGEVIGKVYYDKYGAKPPVKITATLGKKTRILEEGRDYTLSYQNNSKPTSEAVYTAIFRGNYYGRSPLTGKFTILSAPFEEGKVSAVASDLIYTEPGDYKSALYVSVNGVLIDPADYTVRYLVDGKDITNSKMFTLTGKEAAVSVILKGKRYYEETEVKINNCYYIRKAKAGSRILDLSASKIILKGTKKAIPNQQYTGKPIKPTIDLRFSSGKSTATGTNLKLRKGTDYEVYYFDNTKIGTATVFVKALAATGKLINSITTTFKIDRKES